MGLSFGGQYLILSDKHPLIQGRSKKKKSRRVKSNNITGRIFFLRLCFKGEAENFRRGAGENFPCRGRGLCQPPCLRHCSNPFVFPKKKWLNKTCRLLHVKT